MKKFKKYICLVLVLVILTLALGVSYEIEDFKDINVFGKIYATATDESSISTKQSSTKNDKEDAEVSSDMLDLLARVINGEARGEPYLRSSSGWSCNNE